MLNYKLLQRVAVAGPLVVIITTFLAKREVRKPQL